MISHVTEVNIFILRCDIQKLRKSQEYINIIYYNDEIFTPVISQVTEVNTFHTPLQLVKLEKVTGLYIQYNILKQ